MKPFPAEMTTSILSFVAALAAACELVIEIPQVTYNNPSASVSLFDPNHMVYSKNDCTIWAMSIAPKHNTLVPLASLKVLLIVDATM